MLSTPHVDVTRALPAVAGFAQPAAQRVGADSDGVVLVQVMHQQWHRPGRGQVAVVARIALQDLVQPGCTNLVRQPGSAAARLISQGSHITLDQIALDPAANAQPRGAHTPGCLADRMTFGHPQHRLDAAVDACFACPGQRSLEAAAIIRIKPPPGATRLLLSPSPPLPTPPPWTKIF